MTRENFDDLSWRSMVLQFDGECIHCGKKKSKVKVSDRAYIFGLLDCIGEMKRVVLDLQNRHDSDTAKKIFEQMHDLFKKLEVFTEYSNSISELKRKIDVARYVVNETRKLFQK